MNRSTSTACNSAEAQTLIARALGQMQVEEWSEAMRLLESAIEVAPADLRGGALEVLASLYVSKNEHPRLRELLERHPPATAQMVSGALLLTRNRAIGIDGELPSSCAREHVEGALRAHVAAGSYSPGELMVVLALLAQVEWFETAGDIARFCVRRGFEMDPGLIESVLSMFVRVGHPESALRLLDALRAREDCARYPIGRWALLLGAQAPSGAIPPASDKVVRFLQRIGTAQGLTR